MRSQFDFDYEKTSFTLRCKLLLEGIQAKIVSVLSKDAQTALLCLSSLAGTVLDDISKNRTCVHIEQCPCTLNGKTYAPGETMRAACRTW